MFLLKDGKSKFYKIQYIPLGQDKFIDIGNPNDILPSYKRFHKNSLELYSAKKCYIKTGEYGYFNKKITYHVFRKLLKENSFLKLRILKIEYTQKREVIIET